jgi:hypothetical protein
MKHHLSVASLPAKSRRRDRIRRLHASGKRLLEMFQDEPLLAPAK